MNSPNQTKWPGPNLLENVKAFKLQKKRPLVYLDQNILSEMVKGKDYAVKLQKVLLEQVSKGFLACPEAISRRVESTDIPNHWQELDSIMAKLSYGISFRDWEYIILSELMAAKNKIENITNNRKTNEPISYTAYLDSDPNKEQDNRIINFLGSKMMINVHSKISDHEKKLRNSSREKHKEWVLPAEGKDKIIAQTKTRKETLVYLIEDMHYLYANYAPRNKIYREILEEIKKLINNNLKHHNLRNCYFYLPFFWTSLNYNYLLLKQKHRVPRHGDLYDINGTSLALLCCDYLFVDSEMKSLTEQLHYDAMFGCKLYTASEESIRSFIREIENGGLHKSYE